MSVKILGAAALLLSVAVACNNNRVQVSATGLKYQLHEETKDARKPKVGDVITLQLILKNGKDSVMRDTHKEPQPLKLMLQVPPFKGSFEEGLAMIGKGDSATFFVSADSLFGKAMQPMPAGVLKGTDISFTVKMLDVQSEDEARKTAMADRDKQGKTDEKIVTDYLAKNNMTAAAKRTASGLYYVITQPGTGPTPNRGDMVKVHYTGKLTDGKEFDSSKKTGQPIDLPIGVGQVIPGWDEGILLLNKGAKAVLVIPSSLGYGPQATGPIPANSVLVFDVELVSFTKGAAGSGGPMGPPQQGAGQ
jgi:FKBP-type peptidyl-prolyl cis-trans isomerase FkpA